MESASGELDKREKRKRDVVNVDEREEDGEVLRSRRSSSRRLWNFRRWCGGCSVASRVGRREETEEVSEEKRKRRKWDAPESKQNSTANTEPEERQR
jgi:hypothetical protein